MRLRETTIVGLAFVGSVVSMAARAGPGDTLFYNNLNGNLNDFTVVASGGNAGISNKTANQGRSLELRWGPVSVHTDPIAAAVPGAELSLWIRRGDDSFSENPDAGEDLVIEYRNAANGWVEIARYDGSGTPGEVYTPTLTLPPGALHGNLSIRVRLTAGSGSDNDYWHVDDIRVTETAGPVAPPFTPGTCEDFEGGLGGWIVTGSGGDAGTSGVTAGSGASSLYTRWGVVAVTSVPIDLSAQGSLNLDVWVQRGSDAFSENPEAGEDLVIEYLTSGLSWAGLETFPGGGTAGEMFSRSYALPANAYHIAFSLRIRQTGGSGSDWDYWHVDDICLGSSEPILFSFDETSWSGAPDEVLATGSSGLTGTAFGGLNNDDTTPALSGNPGTCRYGDFDGVDDYIEIADDPALDVSSALTIGAWINMRSYPSDLHTIASKDWNYEFHVNSSGQIYWWWNDSAGTTRSFTTAASINLNQWYHVAIVYASGSQTIYVNGNVWATAAYTGTLRLNDLPFYVGTDWNFVSRAFDGFIDELAVEARAYSLAEIQALRDATHPCPTAAAEFSINHDGFGIHCVAETISVDVIDAVAGTPLTSYQAIVELDTQTGNGTWGLVSGAGTLIDATPDDGRAVYDWPLNESQAVFSLSYPQGTPVIANIEVYQQSDPGVRDNDMDGPLTFSPNGFTLTAAQLPNPPPATITTFDQAQTAGADFALHIAAYGQTPNDPVCGVIEGYDGPKNLQFWSAYLDPASGTIPVTVDTGIAAGPIAGNEAGAGILLTAFAAGRAEVLVKYKDVGSIQVAVKDETTVNAELPQGIRGATAGYVSRPASFSISDIRDQGGTIANPAAQTHTDPKFIAAGAPFRVTVTALDAEGDATPNYGRESIPESVRLQANLVAPSGGLSPGIGSTVGFGPFGAGSATGTDFYWPEVGIIRLLPGVGDLDYLGAGDVVGTESVEVGRFVPDHFVVSQSVAPFFLTQCDSGSFTYAGESFGYDIAPQLTATARAANNAPTRNYTGDFFKMTTLTLANRSYTSASGLLDPSGVPPATADPTVTETAMGVATLVFSSGAGLLFDRSSLPAPFFANIELSIDVLDADDVAAIGNPVIIGSGGGIAFTAGAEIRYGRLAFTNAVGSELVNLPVPLRAEYFAGAGIGFVDNVSDSCTTNVDLTLAGFTENLAPGETCVLDSGSPGSSGAGCAAAAPLLEQFAEPPVASDFNLTLAAPGSGNYGGVRIDSVVPDWLRFDWDSAVAGDENPSGHATFGLYGGDPAQIYLRELYH